MSANKLLRKLHALLIPAGVLGLSSALAATQANAETTPTTNGSTFTHFAERLTSSEKVSAYTAQLIVSL